MSIGLVGLQLDGCLSGFRAVAKHVVALIVVIGVVADVEGGAGEFPGGFVVSVISGPGLSQRRDGGSRFRQILAAVPQRLGFGHAVRRNLRITTARQARRRFRAAPVTRNTCKSNREKSASNKCRT